MPSTEAKKSTEIRQTKKTQMQTANKMLIAHKHIYNNVVVQ